MATATIYWGDGTSDKLTVVYTGSGSGTITVSSDPNTSAHTRTKTLTVRTANGSIARSITVTQQGRKRSYSPAYHDKYK
ncbi:MAG: hypothetical protein LUD76_10245 [Alistipes sp.]|nr:hypothetical protein [Alistipes sp.]